MMKETAVESYLRKEILKRGGICEKWTSYTNGWPDRICLLPHGIVIFIETKRPGPGGVLRPIQKYQIGRMRQLKASVYVAASIDDVDCILGIIDARIRKIKAGA